METGTRDTDVGWEDGGTNCGGFSETKIRFLNTEDTESNRTLMTLIGQMDTDMKI